jgi:SRSO17 transposase
MTGMDLHAARESEARFETYVQELASVTGHKDREEPLRGYSRGLLTAAGRKSVEPLAGVTAPAEVSVKHQSLLHFVGQGPAACGYEKRVMKRMNLAASGPPSSAPEACSGL